MTDPTPEQLQQVFHQADHIRKQATRYVKIAPKTLVVVGSLAGTLQPHQFVPDAHTGSSCLACFAACDAVQHPYERPARRVGVAR